MTILISNKVSIYPFLIVNLVIAKPLMQRYSPFTVITYVFTFGLFYMLIYVPKKYKNVIKAEKKDS